MNVPFDAEAYCDHMAGVLALEIKPEWRPAVVDNLKATRAIADEVLTFPLADDVEPAPVFEP